MIITYYGNQFFKIAQGDTVIAINPPAKDGKNGKDAARFGSVLALSTTAHPDYTSGYQMSAQLLIKGGRDPEARQRLEAGVAAARRTGNALALNEMSAMLDELSS